MINKSKSNQKMKKLFIILLLLVTSTFSIAQEKRAGMATSNENIYGTWQSWDGTSLLYMNYEGDIDTFYRMSSTEDGKEVAEGKFTVEDKFLYVEKVNESYNLLFYLKGMQLIVMKPDSAKGPGEAWLFQKVSDYGLSK
tara:strand:- start:2249 stop:2665 length:417 start_codon:yes stop_codon:yes gene_type:complete